MIKNLDIFGKTKMQICNHKFYDSLIFKPSGVFFTGKLMTNLWNFFKNKLIFIFNIAVLVLWIKITYKLCTNFYSLSIYNYEFYLYLSLYSSICGFVAVFAQVIRNCAFDQNKTNYFTSFIISFSISFIVLPLMVYFQPTLYYYVFVCVHTFCMFRTFVTDFIELWWNTCRKMIKDYINTYKKTAYYFAEYLYNDIILFFKKDYSIMGPSGEEYNTQIPNKLLMNNAQPGSSANPSSSDPNSWRNAYNSYNPTQKICMLDESPYYDDNTKQQVIAAREVDIQQKPTGRYATDESLIHARSARIKEWESSGRSTALAIRNTLGLYFKLVSEHNIPQSDVQEALDELVSMGRRLKVTKRADDFITEIQPRLVNRPYMQFRLRDLTLEQKRFVEGLTAELLSHRYNRSQMHWANNMYESVIPLDYAISRSDAENRNIRIRTEVLKDKGNRILSEILLAQLNR